MKEQYIEKRFNKRSLALISIVNDILNEYEAKGYRLTVRQLYYQLVSQDLIQNTQKEYKRIGENCKDARLAGLLD